MLGFEALGYGTRIAFPHGGAETIAVLRKLFGKSSLDSFASHCSGGFRGGTPLLALAKPHDSGARRFPWYIYTIAGPVSAIRRSVADAVYDNGH